MSKHSYDVLGIGGLILDQILAVSDEYLLQISGKKGGMEPIHFSTLKKILEECGSIPYSIPGGSARNTISGMASLGQRCAFMGKIGHDENGKYIVDLMKAKGINLYLSQGNHPTGIALSLITPDGQRTMRTFLGASVEMNSEDVQPEYFEHVKLVHFEGYALNNGDLIERGMHYAKKAGATISFDLASFEIVHSHKQRIIDLLQDYVDIVFANELEAMALTALSAEQACDIIAELCQLSIVLLGSQGCWIKQGNCKLKCPAYPVIPVDTTGAGDLFASGFLHGYLRGFSLKECAHYGAVMGRAVVQIRGAEISDLNGCQF